MSERAPGCGNQLRLLCVASVGLAGEADVFRRIRPADGTGRPVSSNAASPATALSCCSGVSLEMSVGHNAAGHGARAIPLHVSRVRSAALSTEVANNQNRDACRRTIKGYRVPKRMDVVCYARRDTGASRKPGPRSAGLPTGWTALPVSHFKSGTGAPP